MVALGSVLGTIKDIVDELASRGMRIGALGINSFRPFPLEAVRGALAMRSEWSCWSGRSRSGSAASCRPTSRWRRTTAACAHTVIAGLGGRADHQGIARGLLLEAAADELEPLTFLDLTTT